METGIGRRIFVGSVVAGLPLLASSTAGAVRLAGQATHNHLNTAGTDPVIDHIVRQMAAAHNALRRERKGEFARAFAAQLKSLAVYARATGLDARVKSGLATLVEREGRDNVLYAEIDRNRMRAELKAYGVQSPDERVLNAQLELDYAGRRAIVDAAMTAGPAANWEKLAAMLELSAQGLDRRQNQGSVLRVSLQDPNDAEYWKAYCETLFEYLKETQLLATLHCAAALIPVVGVAFAPLCAAYQIASLIYGMMYAGDCLNARF